MKQERKHSPLPWAIINAVEGHIVTTGEPEYRDRTGLAIVRSWKGMPTEKEAEANAAFIVRACNNHHKLVEALREVYETVDFKNDDLAVKIHGVLAEAEAE